MSGAAVLPRTGVAIGRNRRLLGAAIAVAGLPLLTAALLPFRTALSLPSHLLLFLLGVVLVALVGGIWPSVLAALAATLLLNWFFTPPYGTLLVESRDAGIALAVFVLVALAVSAVVEIAGRLAAVAARSEAESRLVAELAGGALEDQALPDVLHRMRETFGLDRVHLQEQRGGHWEPVAGAGERPGAGPVMPDGSEERRVEVPGHPQLRLLAVGPPLFAEDRRVLDSFATAAATALDRERLAGQAADAGRLAAADRMRTALLAAVGHDLRTPLSAIKAAASSLRQPDIRWSTGELAELHATIEESADQLNLLVANLLDMSRLEAGVLSVSPRAVGLDEVVARALRTVEPAGTGPQVHVDVPDDLPDVRTDPGLLERVVANLVTNALRHGSGAAAVRVAAGAGPAGSGIRLQVIDDGPGVPAGDRDRIFAPFQRLDDHGRDAGVGLGLAVARGFTEALGGTLEPTETPGGGLTMTVTLPAHPR